MTAARAPLTSEETARRAKVLAGLNTPPSAPTVTASDRPAALPPIVAWQVELAREMAAGRGIDALREILTHIKEHFASDEPGLLSAIDEMRECAARHLSPPHEYQTVEAIFDAVFPTLNSTLDAAIINQDVDAEIQRLAKLGRFQYERERIAIAARLGIRASALDAAIKAARPQDTKGQGRAFELETIEPWAEPVNGAKLLDEICTAIRRYIVLPPIV